MNQALIIDDSRTMRHILGSTMRELGFQVSEASNGREGLDTIRTLGSDVKLVMVDWNMPEMNGLEFVTQLRQDHLFDSATVIMVTTETSLDQIVKALEAGANEYIMKPFTKEVIEDKLKLLGILN